MNRNANLFHTKKTEYPLLEGKNIWHFSSRFSENRFYIIEKEIRKDFLTKRIKRIDGLNYLPKDLKNDYETYRIAIRKIASNTNERTLIVTVIPKNSLTGNSLTTNFPFKHSIEKYNELRLSYSELLILVTILNSYVLDYVLRSRVTTNLNSFYLYQLPVPKLIQTDFWYKPLIERAAKLICSTEEFAELWENVTNCKWSEDMNVIDENDRNKLKAELDGIIGNLYGLNEIEYQYILSTFPIISSEQKAMALTAFQEFKVKFDGKKSEDVLLKDLIAKGESPFVEFKSTLRIDLKTNKPEKFIEHSVIKTLAAFLNSDGGTLIIGVEDNKNILGLDIDFNSFSKDDKLDEFQKHFDNLISKTLGNRFHHYLKIEFPEIQDKTVCVITINQKSKEPVYVVNDSGQETFYIRRTASTIDLKPSEQMKYIKEHWN
jgi:hypothetical protein